MKPRPLARSAVVGRTNCDALRPEPSNDSRRSNSPAIRSPPFRSTTPDDRPLKALVEQGLWIKSDVVVRILEPDRREGKGESEESERRSARAGALRARRRANGHEVCSTGRNAWRRSAAEFGDGVRAAIEPIRRRRGDEPEEARRAVEFF